MPIQRYMRGQDFPPEAVATLSEALAMAARDLEIPLDSEAKRELMAQLVVQAALAEPVLGARLDAAALSRKAVATYRTSTRH
jgi:hypothetical protein